MRSIDLLREQHRSLEKLVSQALAARGPERIRVLGELAEELILHSALEEEHLYPALQQNGMEQAAERALRDHERIRELVGEILEIKRHDPRLDGKVSDLASATREHFATEERTVFPALEASFNAEQLETMGDAMRGMADRLRGAELLKIADERESAQA